MDNSAPYKQFTASQVAKGTATNATATATATHHGSGPLNARIILGGVIASYASAVASVKIITVTYTDVNNAAATLTLDWDFTNGPLLWTFPLPIATAIGTDVTATLPGGGAVLGTIQLVYMEV